LYGVLVEVHGASRPFVPDLGEMLLNHRLLFITSMIMQRLSIDMMPHSSGVSVRFC
jgi:hypothetical protein